MPHRLDLSPNAVTKGRSPTAIRDADGLCPLPLCKAHPRRGCAFLQSGAVLLQSARQNLASAACRHEQHFLRNTLSGPAFLRARFFQMQLNQNTSRAASPPIYRHNKASVLEPIPQNLLFSLNFPARSSNFSEKHAIMFYRTRMQEGLWKTILNLR